MVLQSAQESCIFGPPIGIEKIQPVREAVMIGLPHDAEKGRDSDSACEEHGCGFAGFLCRVKEPAAEPIFTSVTRGTFFSERLKAVSRIRVVNTNSFSNGGLAMEKVRVFPWRQYPAGS